MISFIIIGRNEGWKLHQCFRSVQKAIEENRYIPAEVIYIDSNSTDDSIEIAKEYDFVSVYRLTSDYNSPIARNLGAARAEGDILFFIDGDMEIESTFLKNVINQEGELCYPFIGGYYIGKYYNESWEFLFSRQFPPSKKIKTDYFEAFTGGLFIISKKLWDSVGGMKNYMTGGADPELALRLADRGTNKLWINKPMAVHHTTKDIKNAGFKYFLKKRSLRGRILLYRENMFSKYALLKMIRSEYTAIYLFFAIIFILFNLSLLPWFLGIYFLGLMIKSVIKYRRIIQLPVMLFKDLVFITGFIFYWPDKRTKISYEKLS